MSERLPRLPEDECPNSDPGNFCCLHFLSEMDQTMPPEVVCCYCGGHGHTYMATDNKHKCCGPHVPDWQQPPPPPPERLTLKKIKVKM